jgi:hypothetical protein
MLQGYYLNVYASQGADRIWRLGRINDSEEYRIQGFIDQPQGSGPRHIAILSMTAICIHINNHSPS